MDGFDSAHLSLAAAREAGGKRVDAAFTPHSLAQDYTAMGRYDVAQRYLDEALATARQSRLQEFEPNVLWAMGHVANAQGDRKDAADYYQRALDIFDVAGADERVKDAIRDDLASVKQFRWPWQRHPIGPTRISMTRKAVRTRHRPVG